jgi:hypothetical protein
MTGSRFVVFLLVAGAVAVTALLAMPVESYDALGWGDVAGSAQAADPTPVTAPLIPPTAARTAESAEHAGVPRLWLR